MFSRRCLLVGVVVVGGVVAGPAFGDVSGSGFVPVTGDDVLLRQARESLSGESGVGSSGSAVNPSEFSGLSDAEALSLAGREFGADLGGSLWSAPVLPGGSRIAGYASDSTAIVDGPGGRMLLTSLLPLRSPDGPGDVKAPVSTSLEARTGGYEPANPLTPVVIPSDLGDGVGLGRVGVGVTPIGVESADGTRLGSDKVFFANVAADTDVVVGALPDGVETFTQIRSADSPAEQGLRLTLPSGASLERAPDGFGEVVKRDGVVIARVSPASAVDASGRDVPVSESVHGDVVSIHVDDSDSGVRYPILLDPTVTVDSRLWDTGTSSTSLVGWEYKTTNLSAFSSSTSGGWGRGLYSLAHAGMINATDAGEWRYTAPGDSRIVSFGLGQVGKPAMRLPNLANGFVPICTSQGIRAAGTYGPWATGSNWQSGTSTGNGPRTVCQGPSMSETPTFCAAPTCSDTGGSPGNAAITNQWAYGAGKRLLYNNDIFGISEYDFIGAGYISIADDKPPTAGVVGHSATLPTGPVNHFTDTVTIGGNDTGTGIWHLTFKARDKDGHETVLGDQGYYCDGSRTAPCAASWNNPAPWPAQQSLSYDLGNLIDGQYTLTATARDRVGNTTEAPADQRWTVNIDRTAPSAPTIDQAPPTLTNSKTATVNFTGEQDATSTCTLDGTTTTGCTSPLTLNDLNDGNHTLTITQTDTAGNTGPASTNTWMLDTTAPNVTPGGSLSDGRRATPPNPCPN